MSVSLTAELKTALRSWVDENEHRTLDLICNAAQAGYRVTVKSEDEGYSASMAFIRPSGPNTGLVLVERGSTPQRALQRLLWAHNSHFDLVWPRNREATEQDW